MYRTDANGNVDLSADLDVNTVFPVTGFTTDGTYVLFTASSGKYMAKVINSAFSPVANTNVRIYLIYYQA